MNRNKELHLGILSSIVYGHITPEKTIHKTFETPELTVRGFHHICDSLRTLNFRENEALNLPTSNVCIFEKVQWPYLITVSYESSTVMIALTDKIKLVTELISTL